MNPSGVGMRRLRVRGTTANQEVVLKAFSTIQSGSLHAPALPFSFSYNCSALLLGYGGDRVQF
jgi:hypothetical protein